MAVGSATTLHPERASNPGGSAGEICNELAADPGDLMIEDPGAAKLLRLALR